MIRKWLGAATVMATSLSATTLLAHHGWSGYDSATVLTIAGSVDRIAYANPHVEIAVKASDKIWTAVLAPPFRMGSRGLPDGSLKVGDSVTLIGYPHKTNTTELRAERIVVAGKTIELR